VRGWVLIAAATGCFQLNEPGNDGAPAAETDGRSIDAMGPVADADPPVADAVLSEVTIGEVEDTFVHLANPTFNNGASIKTCADVDDARVALLRFDVSSIPPDAKVTEAVLRIVTDDTAATDGSVDPYTVHEMLETWIEGTLVGAVGQASWNERMPATPWTSAGAGPGSRSPVVAGTFTPMGPDTEFLVPLDVALVQRWVTTPGENRGVAIVASTIDGACFVSSEEADATKRPSLRLTVALP
jgi:hypothetical protein